MTDETLRVMRQAAKAIKDARKDGSTSVYRLRIEGARSYAVRTELPVAATQALQCHCALGVRSLFSRCRQASLRCRP